MAKRKHLKVLERGVENWNLWRKNNPVIKPDLKGANLSCSNLAGADFSNADIKGVNFRKANLAGADFSNSVTGVRLRNRFVLSFFLLFLTYFTGKWFFISGYLGFSIWLKIIDHLIDSQGMSLNFSGVSAISSLSLYSIVSIVVFVSIGRMKDWGIILAGIFWAGLFAAGAVAGFEIFDLLPEKASAYKMLLVRQGFISFGVFGMSSLSLSIVWALSLIITLCIDWKLAFFVSDHRL